MDWVLLLVSGVMEAVWAIALICGLVGCVVGLKLVGKPNRSRVWTDGLPNWHLFPSVS